MKEGMEIYIQGLRSLRDAQAVSIGKKLTFLVGPNSAGKSTVLLALQKLEQEGLEFEPDLNNLYKNPRCDEIAQLQMLGIGYKDSAGIHHANTFTHFFSSEDDDLLRFFGTKKETESRKNADAITNIDFLEFINSEALNRKNKKIIFAENNDYIKYRSIRKILKNQSIQSIYIDGHFKPIAKLLQPGKAKEKKEGHFESIFNKLSNKLARESGFIAIKKTNENTEATRKIEAMIDSMQNAYKINKSDFIPADDSNLIFIHRYNLHSDLKKFAMENNLHGAPVQSMKNAAESLFSAVNRVQTYNKKRFLQQTNAMKIVTINANRSIPKESDLHLFFGKESGAYYDIFDSSVINTWTPSLMPKDGLNKSLILKINHSLSGDLFIDNGYQISVSAKFLLNRSQITYEQEDDLHEHGFFEDSGTAEEDAGIICADFSKPIFEDSVFFCEISLKDGHGQELKFSDVGSGIGYVFPILYEIFRAANKDHIVFIQQPELHLHPAMQANLTDTLIRATSDRRIIAETHSEHMILRALKRIRQTSNGSLTDPELALTPEDVAINYFEPQGDGTTRVHNIRIGADGDFLDKWPQGFFAERDQELFDE